MAEIYLIDSRAQQKLFVTVYNLNLGLVKEIRTVTLPKGEIKLQYENIPSKIDSTTVHLRSLISPNSLRIIEQKYEYDLLTPEKLFEKYVGREVILVSVDPKTGEEKREKATLLSVLQGKIYKIGDKIVTNFPGRVDFPELPKDLFLKPTLSWVVRNSYSKPQKIEISYLTEGLNWKSYYVAIFKEKDSTLNLTSWISIENKSGADFKQAILKLIAGEIQRLKPERIRTREIALLGAKAPTPKIEEKEFFEYHVYSLPRLITLNNNEIKQISFFHAEEIPVTKKFVLMGRHHYFYTRKYNLENEERVDIYLYLENKKENNLGFALPQGVIRVFSQDKDGQLQFVGEDKITHTPQGEKIRLKVGKAFDVIATSKQISYKKISNKVHESSFEITINNHKNSDIVVDVIEPVNGEWEIVDSNYPYHKIDAYNFKFEIPIGKKSQSILTYTIRIKY